MKLSHSHPGRAIVIEVEKERDQWKADWERTTVENIQLKALYEEAVQHMSDNETKCIKSQQTIATLQEQLETAQTNVQCCKCS